MDWETQCLRVDGMFGLETANHLTALQYAKLHSMRDNLPCKVLQATALEGCRLGLIKKVRGSWVVCNADANSVQAGLVGEIQLKRWGQPSPLNEAVLKALKVRVGRWACAQEQKNADTKRVVSILWHFGSNLPPCVMYAFLCSQCFGWLTDRRLQQRPFRECVFRCGSPESVDDLYHYACCPNVWQACHRIGLERTNSVPHDVRRLLLLEGDDNMQLRLTFLHAVMISVHKLRGPHASVPTCNRERYIRTHFRETVSRTPMLKKLFNELWVGYGHQRVV